MLDWREKRPNGQTGQLGGAADWDDLAAKTELQQTENAITEIRVAGKRWELDFYFRKLKSNITW